MAEVLKNTVGFGLTRVLVVVVLFFNVVLVQGNIHRYTFVTETTTITRLCKKHNIITVNGLFPGPTLHVRNGDTLMIKVHNRAKYNVTIHWHGIRQFRTGWSDGPEFITQCPIRPGGSYTYKFTITYQEGTLWWHAHSSWLRATVYGALIIYPRMGTFYPFTTPHRETILLLGEWWNRNPIDVVNQATRTGAAPNVSDAFTINGQPGDLYPCSRRGTFSTSIFNGETRMLRVINAALNTELFFTIANHKMTVVAVDAGYTKPFRAKHIMLGPGQTTDVIIRGSRGRSGSYYMAARAYSSAQGVPFDNTTTTAILHYKSPPPQQQQIAMPLLPPYNDTRTATFFSRALRSLGDQEHPVLVPTKVAQTLFFTVGLGLLNCAPTQRCGGPNGTRFAASLNNFSFVLPSSNSVLQAHYFGQNGVFTTDFPDRPPVRFNYTAQNISRSLWSPVKATRVKVLKYNTAVQVVLQGTNVFAAENHPIHLHGYDFYVVGEGFGNYDPRRDPLKFNLVDPPQRNTVAVPVNGWAAIRFVADNPGAWLMHCHLDVHITWGLAMVFLVENGPSKLTSIEPPPPDLPRC